MNFLSHPSRLTVGGGLAILGFAQCMLDHPPDPDPDSLFEVVATAAVVAILIGIDGWHKGASHLATMWDATDNTQTLEKDASHSHPNKIYKNRLLSSIVGLWSLLLVPLVQGRELHEGLTHKRDWSKVSHQFNLGNHLMTPTARDRHVGIENSRRLARNAMKLGIDDETHRKVRVAPIRFAQIIFFVVCFLILHNCFLQKAYCG